MKKRLAQITKSTNLGKGTTKAGKLTTRSER
jgi:hypothetical protein